jgi:hypothetical protein
MQRAGRNDQVKRMRFKILLKRFPLQIKVLESHEGVFIKLMLSVSYKSRRRIGEYILCAIFRQNRNDKARYGTGSTANL